MQPLYKITMVIWAPNADDIAVDMKDRPHHCAKLETELVSNPVLDPDWPQDVVFRDGDFYVPDERNMS